MCGRGVFITKVERRSRAEAAGLKRGDQVNYYWHSV